MRARALPIVPVASVEPMPRARSLDGYSLRNFNWPRFTGLTLITLSGIAVLFGASTFVGWLWSAVFQ